MPVPINSEPITTAKDKPQAGGRLVIRASSFQFVIKASGLLPVAAALTVVWAPTAHAGDWEITTGVGVDETYSDNANLASDNQTRKSDLITSITPNISIRGSGGRTSLNLDYSLSRLYHAYDTSDDTTIHTLAAAGNLEVWKRVAFIDATASTSRQVIDSGGPVSNSAASQTRNRSDVRSFDISPYFLHHFGSWVETISRTRYAVVTNSSDSVSDNTTLNSTFIISSGRRFQHFGWSVTLDQSKVSRDDSTPTRRTNNADADFTFAVNRKVSLLAGIGYEDIEDGTLNNQPKGITWNAGFSLTPSPRTSLRATYGRRFGGRDISLDATHNLSRRTTFTANFTETQSTSHRSIRTCRIFQRTRTHQRSAIQISTSNPTVSGNANSTPEFPVHANKTPLVLMQSGNPERRIAPDLIRLSPASMANLDANYRNARKPTSLPASTTRISAIRRAELTIL